MEGVFEEIKEIVAKELECSAHNMDHILRVYNIAVNLAGDDADMDIVKAAALLHDIGRAREDNDPTGETDHAVVSAEMALPILKRMGFSDDKILHVQKCILSHRYRTGVRPDTKEAMILFDADKLDSIGAIGVARSYMWVGKHNARLYYKPDIEEYIKNNLGGKRNGRIQEKSLHSTHVEFETKVKYLVDKMYTEKAKEIAKERLEYFKRFLDRLEKEVKGKI